MQGDDTITPRGQIRRVGDKNKGRAVALLKPEKQIDDRLAIGAVEVACGFIRQHDIGPWSGGTGQGHALLLTARKLRGVVTGATRKPDGGQFFGGAGMGVAMTGQLKRRRDVFQRRHRRDEVEGLEHNTEMVAA